jgi:hypothetical protein
MDVTELVGSVVVFMKANPLIALVICGIILFAFYRRPGLSFFVLFLVVLVAGVYYVIMDMSSSAVSEKERLLKKSAPAEQVLRIDPSRMLR